jgi:hypothetical protein
VLDGREFDEVHPGWEQGNERWLIPVFGLFALVVPFHEFSARVLYKSSTIGTNVRDYDDATNSLESLV